MVGGAGRSSIFELHSIEKLAVLDGRQDIFAAGAKKLVIVNRQSRMAKRYPSKLARSSLASTASTPAAAGPCDAGTIESSGVDPSEKIVAR